MKKILIVISFILVLSLFGCSGTEKAGQATQVVPEIAEPVMVVTDDTSADSETLLVEAEEGGCNTYCPSFIYHYCGPVDTGGIGYVVTDYTTEVDENCECILNVQEGECALCDDRGEYCLQADGVLE